jgi:hypothetical protein
MNEYMPHQPFSAIGKFFEAAPDLKKSDREKNANLELGVITQHNTTFS